MGKDRFLPPPAILSGIREDLETYDAWHRQAHARAGRRRPYYVAAVAAVVLAALAHLWLNYPDLGLLSLPYLFVLFAGFVMIGVAATQMGNPDRMLRDALHDRLFPRILGFVQDLRYWRVRPPASFMRLPAAEAGAFPWESFNHVFAGRHHGFPFEIWEAALTGRARTGGRSPRVRTVFKGTVVAFEAPKPFPGILLVARRGDRSEAFLRELFAYGAHDEVEIDDSAVDARYALRSGDPACARRMARTDILDALERICETWPGSPAGIALRDDDVFVVLPGVAGRFDLPSGKPDLDYEDDVKPVVAEFAAMLAMAGLLRETIEKS